MTRSSAKRVERWRILNAISSSASIAAGALIGCELGQPQPADDIAPWFDRHLETPAHGLSPVAPSEENRRWILNYGLLECEHLRSILLVIDRVSNRIKCRVYGGA